MPAQTLRGASWPTVGFTGHRDLSEDSRRWLLPELRRVLGKLRDRHGATTLISGMALGADLFAADAALLEHLRLLAYMPCPDQAARWSRRDREEHQRLLGASGRVVVVTDRPVRGLSRGMYAKVMHDRNRAIVRDADVLLAVWDRVRTSGGTAATVGYARDAGIPVVIADPVAAATEIMGR